VQNPGIEVKSCANAVLLNIHKKRTTVLRYFNNDNNTINIHPHKTPDISILTLTTDVSLGCLWNRMVGHNNNSISNNNSLIDKVLNRHCKLILGLPKAA
jgi:hypothetical protein